MAAILQRQPLTIKQQVEELKNWHKQQQSKLDPQKLSKENSLNKNNENKNGESITNPSLNLNSNYSGINIDEMPIKVANNNFISLVENDVGPADINFAVDLQKTEGKGTKPKFSFLKKGEGIARFNMGPTPKVTKKIVPKKLNIGLKLTKSSTKSDASPKNQGSVSEVKNVGSGKVGEFPTLKVPDVKLNFTWKSILSGGKPEDMLEKAISSNQVELMDPTSSIDSSTASLMEKLLAIGKNKLSRDREELRVFEVVEQHMLDSSFCSTSSYVNKLMENAVMSTPNKKTLQNQHSKIPASTSSYSDQLANKTMQSRDEGHTQMRVQSEYLANPSSLSSVIDNHEKITKVSNIEDNLENNKNSNIHNTEQNPSYPLGTWTKPDTIINQDHDTTVEESIEELEQSLHVRFAEEIDYKSFVEQSQSINSSSQKQESGNAEFDESQEWKEDSEDSSSCCSQCSKHESSTEDVRPFNPQGKQLQCHSQCERQIPEERLHVGDLKTNDMIDNHSPSLNDGLDNFPPLLISKLRELEEEIQVFREENGNIRTLRESLERERKSLQEEKRQLNLEKKKIQKEVEEEQKRFSIKFEEEKQKLAKEKIIFEKYSKSLTKNPSREERKEIQALREQLAEMKEELNKKESRWGAAQARVRNQVRVLEEDNKKLREEIENFRKQAKYWDLFNQKKKGKPFNNTKLIHAISEHISNIVLDNESSQKKFSGNEGYFTQNSSDSKTISPTDLKSMYGIKVIDENKKSTLPSNKNTSNSSSGDVVSNKSFSDVAVDNINGINNSPNESVSPKVMVNLPVRDTAAFDERNLQKKDRCQKPCLQEDSSNVIKEVVDESGNTEIIFPNGNIKKMNKITGSEKYIYINGDVEEITHDGTVKYYYSKSRIWQTTLPDGLEIIDFPDGKVEKKYVDGTKEIIYSNNNKKISYPDGSQEIIYTEGTRLKIKADKTHILILPNGQKEIHTEEWKRREYPDGTMKTLYPDGTTETVYSNGRVRLKDKYGNLVMDSGSPQHS